MSLIKKAALSVINNPSLKHEDDQRLLTILTDILLLPPVPESGTVEDVQILYHKLDSKTPEEATLFLFEHDYYYVAIQRIKELYPDHIYSILIYLLEHHYMNGVKMLESEFQPIDYNIINDKPQLLDEVLSKNTIISSHGQWLGSN